MLKKKSIGTRIVGRRKSCLQFVKDQLRTRKPLSRAETDFVRAACRFGLHPQEIFELILFQRKFVLVLRILRRLLGRALTSAELMSARKIFRKHVTHKPNEIAAVIVQALAPATTNPNARPRLR